MQLSKRIILCTIAPVLFVALSAVTVTAQSQTEAEATWLAQYWNDVNLSGQPVVTRLEASVDHNWGQGSPDPAINSDRFSARWTNSVELAEGNYRFTAVSVASGNLRRPSGVDCWLAHQHRRQSG